MSKNNSPRVKDADVMNAELEQQLQNHVLQHAAVRPMHELLSDAAVGLRPFAHAFAALPADIRNNPDRNLADVLGIFTAKLPQQLTVGDLLAVAATYYIIGGEQAIIDDVERNDYPASSTSGATE